MLHDQELQKADMPGGIMHTFQEAKDAQQLACALPIRYLNVVERQQFEEFRIPKTNDGAMSRDIPFRAVANRSF
jgi:hypothetical protein